MAEDLTVWWPKLRVGGMVSGDDYADKGEVGWGPNGFVAAPHRYDWGVRSAVNEFAESVHEQVHVANSYHGHFRRSENYTASCYPFPAWYMFKTMR